MLTKLTKKNQILFAIVGLQAIFFLTWFVFEGNKLNDPKSTEIVVKTVPVDPRDYLSGNYLIMNYEFSSATGFNIMKSFQSLNNVKAGQEVFAVLKKDGQLFVADYLTSQKPKVGNDEVVLKGRYLGSNRIEYGIEKYFINENFKDANARSGKVEVVLMVGEDSQVVIKELRFNGIAIDPSSNGLAATDSQPITTETAPQAPVVEVQVLEASTSQSTTQLPVRDGLSLWLDASASAFEQSEIKDGASISTWGNPAIRSASQSIPNLRPTYSLNAMNGLPAVKFDKNQQTHLITQNIVGGDAVIFVVLKTSNPGIGDESSQAFEGSGVLWSDVGGGAKDIIPLAIAGGKAKFFTGVTESTLTSPVRVDDGQIHIIRITRNITNGKRKLHIDGKISASDNNGGPDILTTNSQLAIGGNTLDERYFDGYISEIIVYSTKLDPQKKSSIEEYLAKKWKVAISAN